MATSSSMHASLVAYDEGGIPAFHNFYLELEGRRILADPPKPDFQSEWQIPWDQEPCLEKWLVVNAANKIKASQTISNSQIAELFMVRGRARTEGDQRYVSLSLRKKGVAIDNFGFFDDDSWLTLKDQTMKNSFPSYEKMKGLCMDLEEDTAFSICGNKSQEFEALMSQKLFRWQVSLLYASVNPKSDPIADDDAPDATDAIQRNAPVAMGSPPSEISHAETLDCFASILVNAKDGNDYEMKKLRATLHHVAFQIFQIEKDYPIKVVNYFETWIEDQVQKNHYWKPEAQKFAALQSICDFSTKKKEEIIPLDCMSTADVFAENRICCCLSTFGRFVLCCIYNSQTNVSKALSHLEKKVKDHQKSGRDLRWRNNPIRTDPTDAPLFHTIMWCFIHEALPPDVESIPEIEEARELSKKCFQLRLLLKEMKSRLESTQSDCANELIHEMEAKIQEMQPHYEELS